MFGVPSFFDELKPDTAIKLAEEGRAEIVRVDNNENCVTADLKKTIDALRKSPGGIKGLLFWDSKLSESDFFEILKATAHHE